MPLVSVVMVAYRDTPYLIPAIAGAFAQTLADFEFVFVDNGVGFTAAQVGHSSDPRWRWCRLATHEGIAGGYNAGVAAATGKYVALMDYDDLSMPSRLERQTAHLEAHPDVALVSALAERMGEQDEPLGMREFCLDRADEHRAYSPFAAAVIHPVSMGRRELFVGLPFRADFPFASEMDFQARATERHRFAVLPEILLRYRWYGNQTTQKHGISIERSRCAIQILSYERRSGKPEQIRRVVDALDATSIAATWRAGSALSLALGHAALAAYQARRSLVHDRSAGGILWAGAMLLRILARRPLATGPTLAMFFFGPVRALHLHPAR